MDKIWTTVMGFAAGVGLGLLISVYRRIIAERGARNRFEAWIVQPSYIRDFTMIVLVVLIVDYLIKIIFSILG